MFKVFLSISLLLLSSSVDATRRPPYERPPNEESIVKLTLLGYSKPGEIDTNTEQVS